MNQSQLPTFGQPFEGGYFGGIVRIGDSLHAVVWAPKAQGETDAVWLDKPALVPGATSYSDSMANTRAMAEAGSPLAQWALGLTINGHSDWCIPARDVLELAYRHLKPTDGETGGYFRDGDNPSSAPAGYPYAHSPIVQTTVDAFQQGQTEAFNDEWHWSSTCYSKASAWYQDFDDGSQGNHHPERRASCPCRPLDSAQPLNPSILLTPESHMPTTLEEIKAAQAKVNELIAAYEAQAATTYGVPEALIALKPGERYAGLLLDEKGEPSHHLVLLPGDADDLNWSAAQAWAKEQAGDLPTRREQSLLFANLKSEFQAAWYWSNEAHSTASAWYQGFYDGTQDDGTQYDELRARAVRRLSV